MTTTITTIRIGVLLTDEQFTTVHRRLICSPNRYADREMWSNTQKVRKPNGFDVYMTDPEWNRVIDRLILDGESDLASFIWDRI